jgi:hypothetical protein
MNRRHTFKAGEEFERAWPKLTPEQKQTVRSLINWIDFEPLRGDYYRTDADGKRWFASWLNDLGVVYRKQGNTIYVLRVHLLGFYLPIAGDD